MIKKDTYIWRNCKNDTQYLKTKENSFASKIKQWISSLCWKRWHKILREPQISIKLKGLNINLIVYSKTQIQFSIKKKNVHIKWNIISIQPYGDGDFTEKGSFWMGFSFKWFCFVCFSLLAQNIPYKLVLGFTRGLWARDGHLFMINSWGFSSIKENEFTRVCSLFMENAGPNEAELGARSQLDRYVLFSIQSVIIKCEIQRHDEETRALHRASTASMASPG